MKTKAVVLICCMGAAALALQTGVKLERKYKKDERDSYAMSLRIDNGGIPVALKTVLTQRVKAVYENGDADIDMSFDEISVTMLGKEERRPAGPSSSIRLTKYGMPALGDTLRGLPSLMVYSSAFGDKELKVGDSAPIAYVDPTNPKAKFSGAAKVESIEAGVVKIVSKFDVSQPELEKPMHIETTALVEVASAKPNRIDGVITGLKLGSAAKPMDSAQFTFERKRS